MCADILAQLEHQFSTGIQEFDSLILFEKELRVKGIERDFVLESLFGRMKG